MNSEDPLKGASAFTIELWLATQGDGRLLGNHDGTNGYLLDIKDGNPRLTINAVAASATTSLAIGAWTHVAAVWGGSSVTVYVNGQVAGSRSGVAAPATSSAGFLIGAGSNGALAGAAAMLDEITLHGRALNQGEIKAIAAVGAGGRCK